MSFRSNPSLLSVITIDKSAHLEKGPLVHVPCNGFNTFGSRAEGILVYILLVCVKGKTCYMCVGPISSENSSTTSVSNTSNKTVSKFSIFFE